MKKIAALILSAMILCSLSVPVFAASGINSSEKAILSKLDTKIVCGKSTIKLEASYKNQAYNYMLKDGIDLTKEQSDSIIASMDDCISIIDKANVTSIGKLPTDTKMGIMRKAQEAASTIGLTLSYNASTKFAVLKDKDGNILSQTDNVIKVTGMNTTPMYITIAILLTITVGSFAVVCTKKQRKQ